ncbi:uncharacterized protein CXorf58-like isoform X2 [Dysidea avara]|uniref:uncharacterized protein CXorf58-like isoform X2 n=1 Tax=Dysidea avara TaxID=196820 RepID=UPI00331E25B9
MDEITNKSPKESRLVKKPGNLIQGSMLPSIAEMERSRAARIIEKWWIRTRNRKVFEVLKRAVCTAEHSVTSEVLRKLCPLEADLLKDPTIKAKVRFRFSGTEFPPKIVFKVFISSGGFGIKYFSGKKVITPASEAARDACKQMGDRKFCDQMMSDACQHAQQKITSDVDVTSLKDYVQYSANMDESPAYVGGKDNTWRNLKLDSLPRGNKFYSIMDYLSAWPLLKEGNSFQKMRNFSRPPTQEEKMVCIRSVTSVKSPPKHSGRVASASRESSRRSKKAHLHVEKMRKMFERNKPYKSQGNTEMRDDHTSTSNDVPSEDDDDDDDDWEREADELYQWSQQLSIDDSIPITPG